jgi:hypothetical protein
MWRVLSSAIEMVTVIFTLLQLRTWKTIWNLCIPLFRLRVIRISCNSSPFSVKNCVQEYSALWIDFSFVVFHSLLCTSYCHQSAVLVFLLIAKSVHKCLPSVCRKNLKHVLMLTAAVLILTNWWPLSSHCSLFLQWNMQITTTETHLIKGTFLQIVYCLHFFLGGFGFAVAGYKLML